MINYFFSRFFYYSSLMVGILLFAFILFHIMPSDPARTILGPNADQTQVDQMRTNLGLDKPLYMQFLNYFLDVLHFDFGQSYVDGRNVFQEVKSRLIVTLSLTALSITFTILYLCVVVFSIMNRYLYQIVVLCDFLMVSSPIFFSGILVVILTLYHSPVPFFPGTATSLEGIVFLSPPAIVLAFYPMAILSGILRSEMKTVLNTPYIRAGRALGFPFFKIVFGPALKSSLIPVLGALSNILPVILTGAFIVEILFSIPGIGSILVKSILEQDLPMLECTVILNGFTVVLINLIFEYLYPLLDHRIIKGQTG